MANGQRSGAVSEAKWRGILRLRPKKVSEEGKRRVGDGEIGKKTTTTKKTKQGGIKHEKVE